MDLTGRIAEDMTSHGRRRLGEGDVGVRPRDTRHRRWVLVMVGLVALLVAAVVANLCMGSLPIPVGEVLSALLAPDRAHTYGQVMWDIRLPRVAAAGMLGGSLALAGLLLQTFFGNPIAGPYILGVSSGAKLVVAAVMVLVVGAGSTVSSFDLVLASFVGSLCTTLVVIALSGRVRGAGMLIVLGVMLGYVCGAATDMLVTFASDANIVNLRNWSMGSFSGTSWHDVAVMTPVVALALVATCLLAKPMGAYLLGERHAQSVGVNIRALRVALVGLSSLLAACVTAFAGPVSFVGIAVPHVVRRLMGTSRPLVVFPATFVGGAVFCLLCDLIARTACAPTEVSLSAVTAIFGAPVVVAMLLGRQREAM